MKQGRVLFMGGVLILTATLIFALGGRPGAGPASPPAATTADEFVAGRNVNMVSGTKLPWGDPWLQRQNEPSISVSSRNPMHLFGGANDYRTIDMPDTPQQQIPGIPIQIASARDAWLGLFKSLDGGQSWITTLLPGYPQDTSPEGTASPIHGFDTACDPCVRAGANGLFFMSGIAFNRNGRGGAVFASRFIDNNNLEAVLRDDSGRPTEDPIAYVDTRLIGTGNPGLFLDMPSLAVDVPRNPEQTHRIAGQDIPDANVYLAYTVFPGNTSRNVRSMLYFSSSTNSGRSWTRPIKISESQQIIQRAVITIAPDDPTGQTLYVAFRRFQLDLTPDAIVIVKSVDGGRTFTMPIVVATLPNPFDQLMDGNRFRTNTYPTMAVDESGTVHIAWTERRNPITGQPDPDGQARIVVSSSPDGLAWSQPQPVELTDETGQLDGHQVMPAMTWAGGRLMLVWYDQRGSAAKEVATTSVTAFIEDSPGLYRHTLDVRAAAGTPGAYPLFAPSMQVSRYLYYFQVDASGEPVKDSDGYYVLIKAEDNPVNYPLFQTGTRPFHGDYLDLASSPQILPPPLTGGSDWLYNVDGADHPTSFHAAWTDNRDVRPPGGNWWGDWVSYNPPYSEQPPDSNLLQETGCAGAEDYTGMRNQNVYTATLGNGVMVGSPGNTKQLNLPGGTAGGRRTFVVFVRNLTEAGPRTFDFSFDGTIPGHAQASFTQAGDQAERSATVGPFSSAALTVYVDEPTSSEALAPAKVDVRENGTLVGYALLNPDSSNLYVADPDQTSSPLDDETHDPHVSNPKVWKYSSANGKDPHPGAGNPRVQNPRVQNSGQVNPRVQNSGQENPRVQNKSATNQNIVNSETGNPRVQNPRVQNTALTDMTWEVTNGGNTTSGYRFDTVAATAGSLDACFTAGTLFGQLLVYKVHTTPMDSGCKLKEEHHDELLVNVSNPRVQNPRVQNEAVEAAAFMAADVGESEPDITDSDATFWLAPGETASVILRVYDPDTTDGVDFDPQTVAAEVEAEAVNTNATAPVIVTQPNVPWMEGNALPAIGCNPAGIVIRAFTGESPGPRSLEIWNSGDGVINYTLSDDASWLSVSPLQGTSASPNQVNVHTVSFITSDLTAGAYRAEITISDPYAVNNPLRVPVSVFISDSGTPSDTTPPTLAGLTPDNGTDNIVWNAVLRLTFDEAVVRGTGSVLIMKRADDSQFQAVDVTSRLVTISDNVVTVRHDVLGDATAYYVQVEGTCFEDLAGNPYPGFSDKTTWSFETAEIPDLIAFYPFQGNADDASGNGNHGEVHGAVTFAPDRFGNQENAISLNGVDAFVDLPNETNFEPRFDLTAFTIVAIVQVQNFDTENPVITKGSNFGNFTLSVFDGGQSTNYPRQAFYVHQTDSGNWSALVSNGPVPASKYFQMAVTLDSGSYNSYVDGRRITSWADPTPPRLNDGKVEIGRIAFINGETLIQRFFTGQIDEIRIYGRPLSATEIAALYNGDR